VRRGAMWTVGSSLLMRFANIAVMAVVARVVAPEYVGIFALAMTVHAFVSSVAELGVASAVARSDLDVDAIAPTVATISIITSAALATLLAVFATPIAGALGSAGVAGPLRVLAISVALIGPLAVPGAQLQREFRQSRVFAANAISFVPSSLVLVLLALHGDGAMAFAWSRVAGQVVMGAIMLGGVPRMYRPSIDRRQLGPLLAFGIPLAAANLLSQVLLNVDYVFVGRLLDVASVGLYLFAFNVASWSTAVIGSMLNGVVLPAFSLVRQDVARLPAAVARAARIVAVIACPIGAMTGALAGPLVSVLYGPQWHAAAPVLAILSIYGVISVLCLLFANIVVAMGRTRILLAVQVAALIALVPAIQLGIARSGIVGVGFAHIGVIAAVTLPVYLVALRRSTGTGPGQVARAVMPPAVAAALSALTAMLAARSSDVDLVRLLVGGVSGMAVYGVLMVRELVAVVGLSTLPRRVERLLDVTAWSRRWLTGEGRAA